MAAVTRRTWSLIQTRTCWDACGGDSPCRRECVGRVQRINLGPTLAMVLEAHRGGEVEKVGETGLELELAVDLTADIADDPAEHAGI